MEQRPFAPPLNRFLILEVVAACKAGWEELYTANAVLGNQF